MNIKLGILAIILFIAYQVRNNWLPGLSKKTTEFAQRQDIFALRKWVRIEFVFAVFLVVFATILANTLPAKHSMVQEWPYSFRLSFYATEDLTEQELIRLGIALFIVALATVGGH